MRDLITVEKTHDQQPICPASTSMQMAAWRHLLEICLASIVARVARKRLELELTHYRRVADTLIKQIDNDTEALAYVQIRLADIYSQLAKLGK